MWKVETTSSLNKENIGRLTDSNHINRAPQNILKEIYIIEDSEEKSPFAEMTQELPIVSWEFNGSSGSDITTYSKGVELFWEPTVERIFKLDVFSKYKPTGELVFGYINGRRHHLGAFASQGYDAAHMGAGYKLWVGFKPTVKPSPVLTLGEKRVRIEFNPGKNDVVSQIKQKSAELINLLQAIKNDEASKTYEQSPEAMKELSGERFRIIALAQTAYEEAAMWAVKAATY